MRDPTYLQERIDRLKTRIEAYEDAALALASTGGIQSYTFDSGQSRQVATRYSLAEINRTIGSMYNLLTVLETRLNGCGVSVGYPAW